MTFRVLVFLCLWSGARADVSVPETSVPCRTVADCWLASDGHAIARPKKERGKRIPTGDCGGHILWLRNRLSCQDQQCVAAFVGDRC